MQTIWTYEVKPERCEEFERKYASDGDWVRLFSKAGGYRGTTLLRRVGEGAKYATIDRWESAAALEEFKRNFEREYRELDSVCEEMTIAEEHVGVFEAL